MFKKKKIFIIFVILATAMGLSIAWLDTRPHWDDTGVTIFLILAAATICGFLSSQKPWLIALAVGVWVPVFNIILTQNYGTLIALVPGFIGSYAGYFVRRII